MSKKITNDEFILKVKEKFGDKYDLSKTIYKGKREKITIICPEHGEFTCLPLNFLNGVGCIKCYLKEQHRICMKNNIEKAKKIHNNFYDYSCVDLDSNDVIDIICPIHGKFTQRIKDHLNGHKCPKCGYEENSEKRKRKYSYEKLIEDGNRIHNGKYTYPKQEIKYFYEKCKIICPEHGEFEQYINQHINNKQGCPKCGFNNFLSSRKYDINEVEKLFKEKNISSITFDVSSYKTMSKPSLFHCKICNKDFKRPMTVFLNENDKCPYCNKEIFNKKRFKTTEEFIKEANIIHNNFYDYSITKYISSKDYVDIICPEHGKFTIEANSHLQGHGCPLHYCNTSKKEKEIADFIISLVGEKNVILNSKKILDSKKELDIFLPNYNIAFEFDGLYWHNELNKEKNYHLDKTNDCIKNNIRLIHIFEDEWDEKQNIIKSMIKNILHFTENKIYARKCNIKIVDSKTSKQFLNENHLQGNCYGSINLGLYYNNDLVSLMVFGSSRHFVGNGKTKYELIRFCNKINTNVIGGASKLFNYFIKNYNPNEIISYADKRWSNGMLYNILNFELYNESKPNYYYVIGNKRIYRYNLRKNILIKKFNCPREKTEKQFCFEQKWYRIYDCGCLCYKWSKK